MSRLRTVIRRLRVESATNSFRDEIAKDCFAITLVDVQQSLCLPFGESFWSDAMRKKTANTTKAATELESLIPSCPLEVQRHIAALRAELAQLSKQYARLEVHQLAVDAMNREQKRILEHQVDFSILTDGALECLANYFKEHPDEPQHGTPFKEGDIE